MPASRIVGYHRRAGQAGAAAGIIAAAGECVAAGCDIGGKRQLEGFAAGAGQFDAAAAAAIHQFYRACSAFQHQIAAFQTGKIELAGQACAGRHQRQIAVQRQPFDADRGGGNQFQIAAIQRQLRGLHAGRAGQHGAAGQALARHGERAGKRASRCLGHLAPCGKACHRQPLHGQPHRRIGGQAGCQRHRPQRGFCRGGDLPASAAAIELHRQRRQAIARARQLRIQLRRRQRARRCQRKRPPIAAFAGCRQRDDPAGPPTAIAGRRQFRGGQGQI